MYKRQGLDDTYQIQYLGFKLGNWTDDQHYAGSSKPKTVTFMAGGSSGQVTFDGDKKVEWVKADPPVTADTVLLEINDVYVLSLIHISKGVTYCRYSLLYRIIRTGILQKIR